MKLRVYKPTGYKIIFFTRGKELAKDALNNVIIRDKLHDVELELMLYFGNAEVLKVFDEGKRLVAIISRGQFIDVCYFTPIEEREEREHEE
ncbi:MAG: hypothetical protein QXX12_03060 [Nanopusillaceae archaeon]